MSVGCVGELLIKEQKSKVAPRKLAKALKRNTSWTVTVKVTRELGKQVGA